MKPITIPAATVFAFLSLYRVASAAELVAAPKTSVTAPEAPAVVRSPEIVESSSPRWARPISVAFVSGVFAVMPIPLPFPHVGLSLGVNLGPWLMLEGGVALPIPMAMGGAKLFFSRGEVAPFVAARYGVGLVDLAFGPTIGVDVSRGDGTYAFAELGPFWDRESSRTVNQVGNTIGKVEWVVLGAHASFGIGKRF